MDPILKKINDNGETEKKRRRTSMKKIESKKSLQVTFSKRRKGLFRKAEELSILCGVEVAVIAFSPAGKAFTFGNVGSAIYRLSADQKKNETEEEKNRQVIEHEMSSRDQSSMMMMMMTPMGDAELDQWLNLTEDDEAWADSCLA